MSRRGSALRAFTVKELRHILRDRQTLLILILLPLAMVVLFGYALRSEVNDVRVVFVDPVPDHASIALRSRFEGNPRFRVVGVQPTTGAVEPLFRRGAADLAVVIRRGFAGHLAGDGTASLLLISDASDPNTGSLIQAYARAVVSDWERELPAATRATGSASPTAVRERTAPPVELRTRMRYNPLLESVNLFVPGVIALVLTLVTALMTAISMSREKERGTLEVLLVSPLLPWQIILGKVLPYLLLAFANVTTALAAAWLVFGVPFRGSLPLLLAASMLYAVVGLALGVLIATVTTSQRAAMVAALAGTMMPSTLLSGMVFPIASLPGWLRPVTAIVPARWFIEIARGIMLKGAGVPQLWLPLLVLGVMLAVLMTAAIRTFRPRLA